MDRQLTDRRQDTQELIAYYARQAKLARLGHTTRRTEEFFLRQVAFLLQEGAR